MTDVWRRPEYEECRRRARAAWEARHPERRKKALSDFRKRNPGRNTANAAGHKAQKRLAKPAWANDFFISEAYALARLRTRLTGIEWQVDHIVPLRSPLVCGLHVEHNLRVITKAENCRKRNRVEEPFAVGHRPFVAAEKASNYKEGN